MSQRWVVFFDLLIGMTQKELRARYKYTLLGFFWMVVNPLIQMAVIGTVFTFVAKEPVPHYFHYLFIGLMVWNFFSVSLLKATPSIVYERNLIGKAAFPREVIPLSIIFSNIIHFIVAFAVFFLPLVFLSTISIFDIPIVIISTVLLLLFTVGTSLIASALNVRFRDVYFMIQALLMIWFYLSPVLYSVQSMPEYIQSLLVLNPLTEILQLYYCSMLNMSCPSGAQMSYVMSIIVVVFCYGVWIFRRESRNFDDWV